MGFQTDLLKGLAAYLASAGIGATWKASGVYGKTDTAIVLRTVPETPDRVITLSTYGVDDDPSLSDSVLGIQVRCRYAGANPTGADDLADAIYSVLHGKAGLVVGAGAHAVTIVLCLRQSAASLGQDANLRWMNTQNFYATTHRPSANRT